MRCWGCIPIHSKGKEYGKGLDGQLGLGARLVRSFTLKTPYPFWALSPPMLKKRPPLKPIASHQLIHWTKKKTSTHSKKKNW